MFVLVMPITWVLCTYVMFTTPSSLPPGTEENKETRELLGVMVQYTVKIRCVVSFGRLVLTQ